MMETATKWLLGVTSALFVAAAIWIGGTTFQTATATVALAADIQSLKRLHTQQDQYNRDVAEILKEVTRPTPEPTRRDRNEY